MHYQRELTDEQIERLFTFCEQHGIKYYDLQVEVVDHLANAVAAKMNESEYSLGFEKALGEVYKSFGKNGFAPIVLTKEHELEAWASKQKWAMFKSFFTWPKAAFTTLLISVFALIPKLLPFLMVRFSFYVGMMCFFIVDLTAFAQAKKTRQMQVHPLLLTKNAGPRKLLLSTVFSNLFILLKAFDCLNWLKDSSKFNTAAFYTIAAFFILLLLISLSLANFTSKVQALARSQYPGAFTTN